MREFKKKETEKNTLSQTEEVASHEVLGKIAVNSDNADAISENSEASGAMSVKVKLSLSDIWFYYKWHILIVLFFVVFISIMVVQMVTRDKFDVRVLYAGPVILSEETKTAVTDAIGQNISSDFNGDGEINSELFDLIIMNENELLSAYEKGISDYFLNPSVVKDNKETLSLNAMAGEYMIFLIDADYYAPLAENSSFETLDSMGVSAGKRYDEYALYLKSLDFAKFYTAFDVFPDDTLICVKRVSVNSKRKVIKSHESHKAFFKSITDFVLPKDFNPAA
jgi:hypothetical protein